MKVWENLSPKHRRLAVVSAVVVVFSAVVALMPEGGERERAKKEEPAVTAVLTDREDNDSRFERLLAQLENMREENRDLVREIERVNRDMERLEVGEIGPKVNRELEDLKEQLSELQRAQEKSDRAEQRNEDGTIVVGQGPEDNQAQSGGDAQTPATPIVDEPSTPAPVSQTGSPIWDQPATPVAPVEENRRDRRGEQEGPVAQQATIRVIEAQKPQAGTEVSEQGEQADEGVYLPAGSIITGTLITGMDAPTGQGARQEPFPALLRVKHEAILPNRFRADVRECFVIVGGFGDLSSERAYLRGESISCVRNDGKVIESNLESYTVGEDGKAGLRGRLVSKQGQLLAKAMMAGVLEGFAGAFGKTPVPTLSLEPSEQPLYQQAFSGDALQSGAVNGVGKALDRLAQFYIDQADGMFPVIEIDAGREVEIVMISGGKLALK